MTCEEIKKILDEYKIYTIADLKYYLEVFDKSDECIDDPEQEEKNCLNSKCYEEFFVPDCRKIIEVYKRYFQKEIKTKKQFIHYLVENIDKKISSIENYMSCKSCNQQVEKNVLTSIKISDSDFKKDFCNNLSIKFSFKTLFETDYTSIGQFLKIEHQVTRDTYIPNFIKDDNIMTDNEEKHLFDVIHTSKENLQNYLQIDSNIDGSYVYLFNLALAAFNRNLSKESDLVLDKISKSHPQFSTSEEYLQLKAKILSSLKKDDEAIEILKKLIESKGSVIDSETYNLLAASIKRGALNEFEKYGDEILLKAKLIKSRDIYHSVYTLSHNYYPALNYLYLQMMLAYIDNLDKKHFDTLKEEANNIWNNLNHKTIDWWSFIAKIEFMILVEKYQEALDELKSHFDDISDFEINDFNILTTLRQLELFNKFCSNNKLKEIITYLKELLA